MTTKTNTLIKRQQALDFIDSYYGKHHLPPSLLQIAEAIEGDSRRAGNVKTFVTDPLIAEGWLYKATEGKYQTHNIMRVKPAPRAKYYEPEKEETP